MPSAGRHYTVLHVLARGLFGDEALYESSRSLLASLLQLGADINAKNEREKNASLRLPIYMVADQRNPDFFYCDVLSIFVDTGADLHAVNDQGSTLLHAIAGQERSKISCGGRTQDEELRRVFEKLLEMGLDPRQGDDTAQRFGHGRGAWLAQHCGFVWR